MESRHCPYLGIIDDPTSHKDFPFKENACHRVKKPVKVAPEYQETHCLCDAYRECPGYTSGWEEGFPLKLRADYDPNKRNIIKSILLWKEKQQNRLAHKKEQREVQDWKEILKNKLQFRKEKPAKEKKIDLDKEPVSKKEDVPEVTIQIKETQSEEKLPEKKIIQDEAALKEYLQSKRGINRLFAKILPWKKKQQEEKRDKKVLQDVQVSQKKEKTKRDWRKSLSNIIPWKKKSQKETVGEKIPEVVKPSKKKEDKTKRDWKK